MVFLSILIPLVGALRLDTDSVPHTNLSEVSSESVVGDVVLSIPDSPIVQDVPEPRERNPSPVQLIKSLFDEK